MHYKNIQNIVYYLTAVCLLFLFLNQNFAQETTLKLDHISIDEGLSNSVINTIFQDSKGFLWFGTLDGLNKYDGYNFTVFKNDPSDSTSIKDNWIQSIIEDNRGQLWIATQRGGVFIYNRTKGTFANLKNNPKDSNSLLSNRVWALLKGDSSIIWIGSSKGLDKYDTKSKRFTHFVNNPKDSTSISERAVNTLFKDEDGVLWIGTWGGGLNRLDKYSQTFIHFRYIADKASRNGKNKIKVIKKLDNQTLLLGTNRGLLKFNKNNFTFIPFSENEKDSINQISVLSVLKDSKNNIWVGTHHNGIYEITNSDSIINYRTNRLDSQSLSDNWVQALLEDKNGNVWIGTGKGINKYSPSKQNFHNLIYNPHKASGLSGDEIISVVEDHEGIIWFGTWNGGLNKYDRKSNTVSLYKNVPKDPHSLPNNIVWSIYEDSNNDLWVGTFGGLCKLNREKENFTVYKHDAADSLSISHSNISYLFEDHNKNLWIGTWGGGLNLFDSSSSSFKYYKFNPEDKNSISGNLINVIYEDRNKNLWIGTNSNGLDLFVPESNNFRRFQHKKGSDYSISNNSIKTIYEDKNSNLWIGTLGGGINKYDIKSGKFSVFTEKDGLSNNTVYKIIGDDSDNLWISTNKGLSRFNLVSNIFFNYYKSDGLPSDQLNSAAIKLKNGSVLVSSLDGVTIFDPKKITINQRKPTVVITSFKKFGEPKKITTDSNKVQSIKLQFKENSFSIEFAALDYSNPIKNKYAYKLIGFNKDWIYTKNRIAQYTNIDPGNYIFRVKASNDDGIWNEAGASLIIKIVPPFWATIWFKSIVIFIILAFMVWMFRRQVKSIERQNLKLEKLVRKRTAELEKEIAIRKETEEALRKSEQDLLKSNKSKDRFFSIIAHDLKSPFSSLLGYSEWLKGEMNNLSKEELNNSFSNMNKSIKKVFELLQNLLEWARIQNGKIEYNPSSFDLKILIDNTVGFIEFKALNKDIKIINKIHDSLYVYADQNMLNSVFQNLLTNSLKFSFPGEEVIISSKINENDVEVSIKDNGVGIAPENLNNLFRIDIYHSTLGTNEERGTGLGLVLCKELVERNKGKIWVESKKGKGSVFTFTIPLTSAIYKIKK